MALRLPPTARLLFSRRRHPQSLLLPTAPATQHSPVLQPRPQTPKATRALSTTAPRPWLISALSNLTPDSANLTAPPPKTLRARRVLPYPPAQIYTLIADIDSYTHFLPHCPHSRVTKWTSPPPQGAPPPGEQAQTLQQQNQAQGQTVEQQRHPALADLTVGWGPFTQTYTSRVYCVPGSVVEAVSGAASTTIPLETLRAVGYEVSDNRPGEALGEGATMEGIFRSLVTRWTVEPIPPRGSVPPAGSAAQAGSVPQPASEWKSSRDGLAAGAAAGTATATETGTGEWTEVTLSVTFQFANPALGLAVGQLADEKVDEMVEAFEGRARALYGRR